MHLHFQSATGRHRGVLRGQFTQQRTGIEVADLHVHAAGVQARHIQQAVQQFFGGTQRGIHAFGQMALLAGFFAVAQCRSEKSRGVDRLQHVMADCRQEARAR